MHSLNSGVKLGLGSALSIIPESGSNSKQRKMKEAYKCIAKACMKVVSSIRGLFRSRREKQCAVVQRK